MSRDTARELRKNLTEAETFAWSRLRYRQIGGHKFRRQMSLGSFVVDFVCLDSRLIVELDGGPHADQVEADQRRTDWLNQLGFRVLRFWNHDVLREWETVERVIWEALGSANSTPHPSPPPQGGREQIRNRQTDGQ
jgi:very-short-patch-repair endonuclease